MTNATTFRLGTRAVLRRIDPGNEAFCAACGEPVRFVAKSKRPQVICNVYEQGKWNRVEQYHEECYQQAGEPHGTAS